MREGWLCPGCGSAHGPDVVTCPGAISITTPRLQHDVFLTPPGVLPEDRRHMFGNATSLTNPRPSLADYGNPLPSLADYGSKS